MMDKASVLKSVESLLEEALNDGEINEDTFRTTLEVLAVTVPIAGKPWIDFMEGYDPVGRVMLTWNKGEHHFDTECGVDGGKHREARIEHFYHNRTTGSVWDQYVDEGQNPLDGEASVYLSHLKVDE